MTLLLFRGSPCEARSRQLLPKSPVPAPRPAPPAPPRRCRALGACVMGQKMSVKAGDTIPSVVLCDGMQFPPKLVNVADEIKGKKVLIMGLPGAFTPC